MIKTKNLFTCGFGFFFSFLYKRISIAFFFPPGNRAGQQAGAGSDVGARPGDGAPRSWGCQRGGSSGTWDRGPPRQRGRAWQGTAQGGDSGRGPWAGGAPLAKVARGGQDDRYRAPLSPGRAASHQNSQRSSQALGKECPLAANLPDPACPQAGGAGTRLSPSSSRLQGDK